MSDTLGRDAVQAIDKLLANRRTKVGHDFSEATRRLTAWRQQLIERWRQTQSDVDKRGLERVNAAISVVVGGQFPLGAVPWSHVEQVRDDLSQLVTDDCH
jgi:hypothetical protein